MPLNYMTKINSKTGQIHLCFLTDKTVVEILMNGPEARELAQELISLADTADRMKTGLSGEQS